MRALSFPLGIVLADCWCSPPFRFLAGELLLNPLGFCGRTVQGRKPKPSLRAARVTSSTVGSPLVVFCTEYNPSLDLRACVPISICVSNRTHSAVVAGAYNKWWEA